MTKKTDKTKAVALSKDEKAAEDELASEMDANGEKLPKFEMHEDGTAHVNVKHVRAFSEMFGNTKSTAFATALLENCGNVSGVKEGLEGDKSKAVAIVAEIAPQDGVEAMLATQMAAVHIAAMRESRLLATSETIPQFDAHEKAFNKLMRTFTSQMEALRKHRYSGKKTVTIQCVKIEDGGQAIVGNVEAGGSASSLRAETC